MFSTGSCWNWDNHKMTLNNLCLYWDIVGLCYQTVVCLTCPVLSTTLVYCGQTVGWIKVPLGREVGLGPSDIVLHGDPALSHQKGAEPTICGLGPCLLWPNGWMRKDTTWYGGRPQSRQHCVRWGPSSPPLKGHSSQIFGPYPLWPNGWMDSDAIWYGGRPRPRPLCVRWGPRSP